MKRIIRYIARLLRVRTSYMVTATAPVPGGGAATLTIIIDARPWLHSESLTELSEFLKGKGMPTDPNIIMIHRLGP
jgi:hypothetical protein